MIEKMRSVKSTKIVSKRIKIGGLTCYYIIVRNPKAGLGHEDDFLFLLSSWHNRTASATAYLHRWSIEVTFRHLKSNGFELDKICFSDPAKWEVMFAMLNVVFAMCVIEGRKFGHHHPNSQQTKTDHCTGKPTLVHSVFRQGLNRVMATFTTPYKFFRRLAQIYRREPPPIWALV